MKITRTFGPILTATLVALSSAASAEDIDIYSDIAGSNLRPNVLIVLDNAASFSAAQNTMSCSYVKPDGTPDPAVPTLNKTNGGIEQCALHNVIAALPVNSINVGVMVYSSNSITDAYGSNCQASVGGCLAYPLKPLTDANKTEFLNWVKGWQTSEGQGGSYWIKANNQSTGTTMQEAWAYYRGAEGFSGRDYSGIAPAAGCQRNFIVFIGNAASSSSTPGDDSKVDVQTRLDTNVAAFATDLPELKIPITIKSGTFGANGVSCGNYTMGTHSGSSGLYADEWARLGYRTDLYPTLDEAQSIRTYTIGVLGEGCKPDYPALMSSMAAVGGGEYFPTTTYQEIVDALMKILNEIQAVNSVFSSASLPVSVNAQGTYLNQIFLGMFRPDAKGTPRWMGNLKQYQFILEYPDPTKPDPNKATLRLGDADGEPAISSAGTGFITPAARSFWTNRNIAVEPDKSGGFFRNDPHGYVGSEAYDSVDGELVEKGGAAQQLRLENLTADFGADASPYNSANPRRLYTHCPSGDLTDTTLCPADLTAEANAFSAENAAVVAGDFGSSVTLPISSIVRTGTTALVTTVGNHGFTAGTTQGIIRNSNQPAYNNTFTVQTVPATNQFTITGLPDTPTSPSQGTYTLSPVGAVEFAIASVTRSTSSAAGINTEVVSVTTTPHTLKSGDQVTVSGVSPARYNGTFSIDVPDTAACPAATCFTYPITIYPPTPAVNTYGANFELNSQEVQSATWDLTANVATINTAIAHGFHVGQPVTITSKSKPLNWSFYVRSVPTPTSFTIVPIEPAGSPITGGCAPCGTVVPYNYQVPLAKIERFGTTDVSTARATVSGSFGGDYWFGRGIGYKKSITISLLSGSSPNEGAYLKTATITCVNETCTVFDYSINATPSTNIQISGGKAAPAGTVIVNVAPGMITRVGATATITGITGKSFFNGQLLNIAAVGDALQAETAYLGNWTVTCADADCTTLSFGPVKLEPESPATGSFMQVYSPMTPPDKNLLIRWVRGEDNYGDEKGPGGVVKVRPSIHGDVVHSRPVVVNYGKNDPRGLVVFYGGNDGVFRAVNGSQTASIGSGPAILPGQELWGLVMPEHFGNLNRQRANSPELKMPGTILPSAKPKDWFVDGSPGTYQKLKADLTIDKAYIYLNYRRGGRFVLALDVSQPRQPIYKWKKSVADPGFTELGQTWSRPRVTLINGYRESCATPPCKKKPVVVFGAGYDIAEDTQPAGVASMGRGIYVLDAETGELIWKVTYGDTAVCSGTSTQASCTEPDMKWAIPSEITFLDRDNDGATDRLYVGDLGGNVWRVDLETYTGSVTNPDGSKTTVVASTPDKWQVTKLAALGCDKGAVTPGGVCPGGKSARKFFYPPNVVMVGVTGGATSYDMVMLGSGDREHPLLDTTNAASAYNVTNRFYMLKDSVTDKDALRDKGGNAITHTVITEQDSAGGEVLDDATSVTSAMPYDATKRGFYVTMTGAGEKVVNASVTARGTTFFGTNRPLPKSENSCRSNLGEAKGYALNPFTGLSDSSVFDGGGLPPSPIVGIVEIDLGGGKTVKKEFCIGCGGGNVSGGGGGGGGGGGCDSNSALGACDMTTKIPKNLQRTYWYKK